MKPTGKIGKEFGQRSAKESASAATRHSGFEDLRSPNKALVPTTMVVTRRAGARHAPTTVAAHL